MAVQAGRGYEGISSMLIDRMSEVRDTYQAEKKKRLAPKKENTEAYRYSFKSGQINYHLNTPENK